MLGPFDVLVESLTGGRTGRIGHFPGYGLTMVNALLFAAVQH